jgi:hypothetical protein
LAIAGKEEQYCRIIFSFNILNSFRLALEFASL